MFTQNFKRFEPIIVLGINNYIGGIDGGIVNNYQLGNIAIAKPVLGLGVQKSLLKNSQWIGAFFFQTRFGLPIYKLPNSNIPTKEQSVKVANQIFYDLIFGNQIFLNLKRKLFFNLNFGYTLLAISLTGEKYGLKETGRININSYSLYAGIGWRLSRIPMEINFSSNLLPFYFNVQGFQPQITVKCDLP